MPILPEETKNKNESWETNPQYLAQRGLKDYRKLEANCFHRDLKKFSCQDTILMWSISMLVHNGTVH
jgi:hypothetical protein